MANSADSPDPSKTTRPATSAEDSGAVNAATSTSSEANQKNSSPPVAALRTEPSASGKMDTEQTQQTATAAKPIIDQQTAALLIAELERHTQAKKAKSSKKCCHKSKRVKHKAAKEAGKRTSQKDDDTSSESSSSESESESESDTGSSEDEQRKRKSKKAKRSQKSSKSKKKVRSEPESEDESSSSEEDDSDDSEDEEEPKKKASNSSKRSKKSSKDKKRRKAKRTDDDADEDDEDAESSAADVAGTAESSRKKKKASKRSKKTTSDADGADDGDRDTLIDNITAQLDTLKVQLAQKKRTDRSTTVVTTKRRNSSGSSTKHKRKSSGKGKASAHFKRVDQLWDSTIHNYTLKESAEDDDAEFEEYAFLVRRCFDWENRYTETVVDIKSKTLRAVLVEVMKDVKSVSLEAEEPTLDPNILFLYLEELRRHFKKTLKARIRSEKKRKAIKKLEHQRALSKTLVSYIDDDYAETKKTLYPLVEAGNITFDLIWALFKPGEIAITSTYGAWDEPRCFRVEYATHYRTMQRGEWYTIEGKYLEYDGKSFGWGDFEVDIESFKGPRKISSLATYPLAHHKDPAGIRRKIIERGQQFVAMDGMQYKFHKGLAFMKKKQRQVAKININGRIMIDPATFRRINPNYSISFIKPKDADDLFSDDEDYEDDDCDCCGDDGDSEPVTASKDTSLQSQDFSEDAPRFKYKFVEDGRGCARIVAVEVDEDGDPVYTQRVENLPAETHRRDQKFTEDELLLTSPVVLGFAFSEKLWLEFTLSGVRDIEWNESAFDSLVLPPNQKEIVSALVKSHKFNAAKTIDDVVQGKGKGLVAVLHGPPGTGKTLTAEGISELLKVPLYMVSAGELGTDPARLEHELQKILDIAHSWGAVLLLDEADVFLEKREVHDIHRNALVSIFLRLLEYFQGILFLTTNRVETFDDAFQSRIHVALRYGELTHKAKKTVWRMFIDLVRKQESSSPPSSSPSEVSTTSNVATPSNSTSSNSSSRAAVASFSDDDIDILSRRQLNGRQIKNAVRTAQALALHENANMSMEHVRRVLDVAETFDRDLKGGTGYLDAMRSYT